MKFTYLVLLSQFILSSLSAKDSTEVINGNRFAFALLNKLNSTNKNIVFSPYSIRNCFAYVYPGANGNTKKEIQKIMLFDSIPEIQLRLINESNKANSKLQESRVLLANSIWIRNNYPITESYKALVKKYTDAINTLTTAEKINEWVRRKTDFTIRELVKDQEIKNAEVLLLNCLSIDAIWKIPFPKQDTKPRDFYTDTEEGKIQVPTMMAEVLGGYFENASQKIVQLPYKDELSITVVMPKQKNESLVFDSELQNRLVGREFMFGENALWPITNFILYLPKFKIESTYNLIPTLCAMGMKDAFSEGKGDFSKMNPNLIIGLVKQKAVIELDETGTRASAATAVGMIERGAPPQAFTIDKPFYYIIHNSATGEILFMGKVVNPLLK